MKFINQDFQPLIVTEQTPNLSSLTFWEFQLLAKTYKTKDGVVHTTPPHFMLNRAEKWSIVYSPAYKIAIGKYHLILPVNFYLLIADLDAGIDWIRVDEVIGRDFQVFTFASNLEEDSWILRDLKVLDNLNEVRVSYPHTKRPVAVYLGDNVACMVSATDCFSKMNKLSFGDLV